MFCEVGLYEVLIHGHGGQQTCSKAKQRAAVDGDSSKAYFSLLQKMNINLTVRYV